MRSELLNDMNDQDFGLENKHNPPLTDETTGIYSQLGECGMQAGIYVSRH